MNNIDWLEDLLDNFEEDYLIIDCPGMFSNTLYFILMIFLRILGQIELYTHFPIMKRIVDVMTRSGYRVCGVYLLDSQFIEDASKFFAGVMSAMSAMIQLEIPHINVMTKMDLLGDKQDSLELEKFVCLILLFCIYIYIYYYCHSNLRTYIFKNVLWHYKIMDNYRYFEPDPILLIEDANKATHSKFHALNKAMVQLVRMKYLLMYQSCA